MWSRSLSAHTEKSKKAEPLLNGELRLSEIKCFFKTAVHVTVIAIKTYIRKNMEGPFNQIICSTEEKRT